MARLATRPVRGLVALIFVATGPFAVSNFSMLGGSVQRVPTASRTTTHASSVPSPTSASTLQQSIYYKIDKVKSLLQGRAWLSAPTHQELEDYDQKLSANIQMLENLVQDQAMEVETTTEVEWFENILETVGDLKAQLARHRAAEGRVSMPTLPAVGVMPMFLTFGVLLFLAGSASFATIEQTRDLAFSKSTSVHSYWFGSAQRQGMTHEPLAFSRNLTF